MSFLMKSNLLNILDFRHLMCFLGRNCETNSQGLWDKSQQPRCQWSVSTCESCLWFLTEAQRRCRRQGTSPEDVHKAMHVGWDAPVPPSKHLSAREPSSFCPNLETQQQTNIDLSVVSKMCYSPGPTEVIPYQGRSFSSRLMQLHTKKLLAIG